MKKRNIKSAVFQYFRTHENDWEDRIIKIKECGFDTVETIIPWNIHEPKKGKFNFKGYSNIEKFIKLVDKHGLKLITRQSPYTCGEHEGGGIPYWVLNQVKAVRANDPVFLQHTKEWYAKLNPILAKYTEDKGGPIIGTQIENEYGAFSYDSKYQEFLKKELKKYFPKLWIFTSDNPDELKMRSGSVKGVHETLNFGSTPIKNFEIAETMDVDINPKVNMEYWGAWFNWWGGAHRVRSSETIMPDLKAMVDAEIGFNYYMFVGGTNFDFNTGANYDGYKDTFVRWYVPLTTSIDYDAPISEDGSLREKYFDIKELLTGSRDISKDIQVKTKFMKHTNLKMNYVGNINDYMKVVKPVKSVRPQSFKDLDHDFGFVLHRHEFEINFNSKVELNFSDFAIRDRVTCILDKDYLGTLHRNEHGKTLKVPKGYQQKGLTLLVENLGRCNYGKNSDMIEDKGIVGDVAFNQIQFFNWSSWKLGKKEILDGFNKVKGSEFIKNIPSFHEVEFELNETEASYIEIKGSKKGVLFVNGNNIGRYWSIGPQLRNFVPKHYFKKGKNVIQIFESDTVNGQVTIGFKNDMKYTKMLEDN